MLFDRFTLPKHNPELVARLTKTIKMPTERVIVGSIACVETRRSFFQREKLRPTEPKMPDHGMPIGMPTTRMDGLVSAAGLAAQVAPKQLEYILLYQFISTGTCRS